jgi:hypothetical protein
MRFPNKNKIEYLQLLTNKIKQVKKNEQYQRTI